MNPTRLPPNTPRDPDAVSGIDTPTYLLRLARRGLTRFISHLDWIVLLQQAAFRSRLPVVLTEGYNKKLKAKYAPPLPTGVASECEFVQLWLHEPLAAEAVFDALHDKFATDFVLLKVFPLASPVPKNPWKAVVAARYRADLEGDGITPAMRGEVLAYLEHCMATEPVKLPPLAQRRAARKARGGATFGGDEDLMGGGGGGAVVPAARALFEEAGDPRELERASQSVAQSISDLINPIEHQGRVHQVAGVESFLAGGSQSLWITGPMSPSMTLHPMRLSLTLWQEVGLPAPPLMTKEELLDSDGCAVYPV